MFRLCTVLVLTSAVFADKSKDTCNLVFSDLHIRWYSRPFDDDNTIIEEIEISGNDIPVLCENAFRNYSFLSLLKLDTNKILELRPSAFSDLHRLRELNLSSNSLKEIKHGVFNNLSVAFLGLENNSIVTINRTAFDDMSGLRMLYLDGNEIRMIDSEWFKNTPELSHLSLARNEITAIQAHAFKNLQGHHEFKSFEAFLNLDLRNNRIKYIHSQAFDDLDSLGILSLDGNQIEVISEKLFSTLKSMQMLFLSDNKITCLPDKLDNILMADTIALYGNPWDCKCLNSIDKWFTEHERKMPRLACMHDVSVQ